MTNAAARIPSETEVSEGTSEPVLTLAGGPASLVPIIGARL